MRKRYRFGRFDLRPGERQLFDGSASCAIGARAFDVLVLLIERRASIVTRREVLDVVWAGLVVEDSNLTVQISALRKLLGEGVIATVPHRGYQFTLPVTELDADAPQAEDRAAASLVAPSGFTESAVLMAVHAQHTESTAYRAWLQDARDVAVPAMGGTVVHSNGELVASFDTARAALQCARRLHAAADRPPQGVLVLCGSDEIDLASARAEGKVGERMRQLSAPAKAGLADIAISARVAGRLVPALDGDLALVHELHEAPPIAPPKPGDIAIYRLVAQPRGREEAHVDDVGALLDERVGNRTVTLEAAPAFDLQTLLSEGAPTVAVLPFRGYGAVADGIGLGDILADQLITHLAHGDEMHVTSRLSTAAFRERPCSLEDVATHLRANYVVSGRYYEHHGRLTVDVEMADAMRRRVVWKHAASEPLDAVLSPDAMLTLELVGGISRAIFAAEIDRQPLVGMPTLSTHSLMLTAIGLMYRLSPKDFLEARRALDALRERLPSHPAPLAWLSRWHLFKLVQNWTTDRNQEGRVAEECAHRALEIDPNSALALTMLGNVRTNHHRDPVGAEALYDQALAINPNESWAWLQKGNALSFRGEGAAAMQHIERAIGLSPLDPAKHFYQSLYAGAALTAGDYERAITAARASLRLNREHVSTFRVLAIGLSMLGREQEARRVVQTLLHIEPDMTVKSFVARSPGRQSGLAERFGEALGAVGLPLGQ